jgi:hypothetical protein
LGKNSLNPSLRKRETGKGERTSGRIAEETSPSGSLSVYREGEAKEEGLLKWWVNCFKKYFIMVLA